MDVSDGSIKLNYF